MNAADLHTFDRFTRTTSGKAREFQVAGVQPDLDGQGGGSHADFQRQPSGAPRALRAGAGVFQDGQPGGERAVTRWYSKFGGFPGGGVLLRFDRDTPKATATRLHADGTEVRCPHLVLGDMQHLEAIDELHEVDADEAARLLGEARQWIRRAF